MEAAWRRREKPAKKFVRKRRSAKQALMYAVLIIFSVCNAYPILWMLLNSFKSEKEFSLHPLSLPTEMRWGNYVKAWETAKLGTYFLNSIVVSVAAVTLTVFIGALASYFLSRFHFRMKHWIYSFFLLGMLIPIHATLVPMFILMNNLGLLNTRVTLILPYIAFNLPVTIYILVSFMNAFSKDVEESAIIDGCGIFRIFRSIIYPMTQPALTTVAILNFINNWNEFSFALVLINDMSLKTLPLGLANFAGQFTTNYTAQMAGLTMALIPTILFYLSMENHLVKGMTAGAMKG